MTTVFGGVPAGGLLLLLLDPYGLDESLLHPALMSNAAANTVAVSATFVLFMCSPSILCDDVEGKGRARK